MIPTLAPWWPVRSGWLVTAVAALGGLAAGRSVVAPAAPSPRSDRAAPPPSADPGGVAPDGAAPPDPGLALGPPCPVPASGLPPLLDLAVDGPCQVGGLIDGDRDGVDDCWWGQAWGEAGDPIGMTVVIQPGCRGDSAQIDVWRHTALDVIDVPAALREGAWLDTLAELLVGRSRVRCDRARADCPAPDGALAWLLTDAATEQLTRTGPVRRRGLIGGTWMAGAPRAPAVQVALLSAPGARTLAARLADGRSREWLDTARPIMVVYNADYHEADELDDQPAPALVSRARCGRHALWWARSGVAVVDGDRWRWLWQWADRGELSGGEVVEAACRGRHLWVVGRDGDFDRRVMVVDPARGRWIELTDDHLGGLGLAPDDIDALQDLVWGAHHLPIDALLPDLDDHPRVERAIERLLANTGP